MIPIPKTPCEKLRPPEINTDPPPCANIANLGTIPGFPRHDGRHNDSVPRVHARSRSRVTACAHALAHEAVILAHRKTSVRFAGRHRFDFMLMYVLTLRDT